MERTERERRKQNNREGERGVIRLKITTVQPDYNGVENSVVTRDFLFVVVLV